MNSKSCTLGGADRAAPAYQEVDLALRARSEPQATLGVPSRFGLACGVLGKV
jgi:hypothetical protein